MLELARTGNKLVSLSGRPEWMCQAVEVADPVTFTTPDTVLVSKPSATDNRRFLNQENTFTVPLITNRSVTCASMVVFLVNLFVHKLLHVNRGASVSDASVLGCGSHWIDILENTNQRT